MLFSATVLNRDTPTDDILVDEWTRGGSREMDLMLEVEASNRPNLLRTRNRVSQIYRAARTTDREYGADPDILFSSIRFLIAVNFFTSHKH